jgi:hypothetical protein
LRGGWRGRFTRSRDDGLRARHRLRQAWIRRGPFRALYCDLAGERNDARRGRAGGRDDTLRDAQSMAAFNPDTALDETHEQRAVSLVDAFMHQARDFVTARYGRTAARNRRFAHDQPQHNSRRIRCETRQCTRHLRERGYSQRRSPIRERPHEAHMTPRDALSAAYESESSSEPSHVRSCLVRALVK